VAKTLWMLRHGEAVPHGSREDADRELTPRGEHQARTAGRALARLNVEFSACYASPKVRARDTGTLACEELGVECQELPALARSFGRGEAQDVLLELDDGGCALVVGHNPDFEQLVHDFTGSRVDFSKGGVAAVRVDGSESHLVVLMRPAELEARAG
jgi:phosphohistidine phosphatase